MDVASPLGIKPVRIAQPTNQRLSQQASFPGIVAQSPILEDGQVEVRDIVGCEDAAELLVRAEPDDAPAGAGGYQIRFCLEYGISDVCRSPYPEAFQDVQQEVVIPRRMLQKRLSDEAPDLNQLNKAGDYFTMPDPELSERLINRVLARPINTDIIHIAETWFGTRRGKQKPSLTIGSNDGLVRDLRLPATTARGPW